MTPLLSKLFIKQSVRSSPPIGEKATACNHKSNKKKRAVSMSGQITLPWTFDIKGKCIKIMFFYFFYTSFFTSAHQNNSKTPKKINLKLKKNQNFPNARLDRNAKQGLKKGQPNFIVPISSKYLGKRNWAAISAASK